MAHSGTTQSAQHCKLFHSKIKTNQNKTKLHHICYFKTKSRRTKPIGVGRLRAYRPDGQKWYDCCCWTWKIPFRSICASTYYLQCKLTDPFFSWKLCGWIQYILLMTWGKILQTLLQNSSLILQIPSNLHNLALKTILQIQFSWTFVVTKAFQDLRKKYKIYSTLQTIVFPIILS